MAATAPPSAYEFWVGLFLPARTPRDMVARLHRETQRALQVATVRERLVELGVEPMPMSREQFGAYFREDVAAHMNLIKAAGIALPR